MDKFSFFLVFIAFPIVLFGQKRSKEVYTAKDISGLYIDGEIDDWTGHLYRSDSEVWSFSVAISDNKLRAVALIKEGQLIDEAIRNGILLNISYTNKRKDGARLVFPQMNLEKLESAYEEGLEGQKITNEELIRSTKGYYVFGFSKVINGLLSFSNSYGIKAVCKINKEGHLLYEAEVPLDLINFKSKEIAIQLGVNTRYSQLKKLASNQSSAQRSVYGYGYRRMPASAAVKNPYNEPTDVWFSGLVK